MKILYIGRNWIGSPLERQWKERVIKRCRFTGQEGFFEASIHSVADVTTDSIGGLARRRRTLERDFDAVIVNSRCIPRRGGASSHDLSDPSDIRVLERVRSIPKVLLVVNGDASTIPPDELLDRFDLVYRRERLKDIDRYGLAAHNRAKLRTTMLTCLLIRLGRRNVRSLDPASLFPDARSAPAGHDVFFVGSATDSSRADAIAALRDSSLDSLVGLQIRRDEQENPRNRELVSPRVPSDRYADTVRSSKVNLALRGFGQFTHRHIEIWFLGGFMLSDPGIREVTLPIEQPVENEHYAVFEGPDDLVDRVRYFLDHEEKRLRIARNGRELFQRIYNPARHGADILREIRAVQSSVSS